jgi:polyhydroxybutyrate depolymerase
MTNTSKDHKRRNNSPLEMQRRIGIAGLFLGALILLGVLLLYINEVFGITSGTPRSSSAALSSLSSTTCKTPQHDRGDSTQKISSGGLERTFLIHLAPSYGQQPQPVVISYHGYNATAQTMVYVTDFDSLADDEGFITVYPQGYESAPTWNAGDGAAGPTGNEDDVQFTSDMLTYLEKNYCVDSQRIYLVGYSLGGGMAYRLACNLSDRITAIATVSGAYYSLPESCRPTHPVPTLEIHGTADTSAPYDGNPLRRMTSIQDYLNTWLTLDKCDVTPHVFLQQSDVTGSEWTHCAPGVQIRHYRIEDGTHGWPPPSTLDTRIVIWDFFNTNLRSKG